MASKANNAEQAKVAHTHNREFISRANEAAVEISVVTLRSLILINGGAAVAMLGFVATVSTGNAQQGLDMAAVVAVLQLYAGGAALAVLASGCAYGVMYLQAAVAQNADVSDDPPYIVGNDATRWQGQVLAVIHIASVLIAIAAWALFVCGVLATSEIVLSQS